MTASLHQGRRAMVVGGTHGIDLAIAEELVPGGAHVVVTGRDASKASAAGARLGAAGTASRPGTPLREPRAIARKARRLGARRAGSYRRRHAHRRARRTAVTGYALLALPLAVAYSPWAGAGVAAVTVLSVPLFGESFSAVQGLGIALVVGGVVALEMGGAQ